MNNNINLTKILKQTLYKTKIKKQNTYISTYKAQLEKKFSAMETTIAQMQQNYQSFLS